MEKVRRRNIPAFGEWNQQCEELPITQYFESAMQAGLVRASSLLQPPYMPTKNVRVKDGVESQGRKKGSCVADAGAHAPRKARVVVVRAVDEDLYKIPTEMLCKKPRRKRMTRSTWMGCVGLNCVA